MQKYYVVLEALGVSKEVLNPHLNLCLKDKHLVFKTELT